MKFKFVNPKFVDRIVGRFAPTSSFLLARIIDEALDNANQGYVHTEAGRGRLKSDPPEISEALLGIADKLLAHNTSRSRRNSWDLFGELDFDLVHESNPTTMRNGISVNTSVKAYFFHTQYSRPEDERRVVFHLNHNEQDGTRWSISFPVQFAMKGFPNVNNGYFGYSHGIALMSSESCPAEQHNYIGVTKRNWLQRMSEHFAEIRSGSNKTFHSAWRNYVGRRDVQLTSELITANHSFDQIMAWEEWAVDREMTAGTSLNMIPGGFKGMKFLHKHRVASRDKLTLEDRETSIERYQKLNPRRGIPNLLTSQLWKNENYAERVICGADGRLSAGQVRKIRELNLAGLPVDKIMGLVQARNILQVQRVIMGKTYSRIQ